MITLFIDTHYKNIIVALYKDLVILDKIIINDAKSTSIETMPAIVSLLEKNNLEIKDVNRIAVDKGPGSFTGIRIGVTIAKVLAYSLNIPIVSLTSLEIMALNKDLNLYYAVIENNGAFVSHGSNLNDIKYYKKNEYLFFKENNNVVDVDNINFDLLIKYIDSLKEEKSFNVNPIYVKSIEALNDSRN